MGIDQRLAQSVRDRAGNRCEYCRLPQNDSDFRFWIDHVIARQHDGPTVADNLALSCPRCNRRKGPNLSGRDPGTGRVVRLFNPRADDWSEHFRWVGPFLIGQTAKGRATVNVLVMNDSDDVLLRENRWARARPAADFLTSFERI